MSAAGKSYVCGTTRHPLRYATVGEVLDEAVRRWGEREAVVVRDQGVRWSYRQLGAAADRFAAGLLKLGLRPGDRVGIWSPNNIQWIVTQFATAKADFLQADSSLYSRENRAKGYFYDSDCCVD